MVRVGLLIDQMLLDRNIRENKTELTAAEQLDAVLERVRVLNERKDLVYSKLMGRLEEHNVRIVDFRNIDRKENQRLEEYFNSEIIPFLSPVIVGDRQPFPFLKNKEICISTSKSASLKPTSRFATRDLTDFVLDSAIMYVHISFL